MPGVSVTVAEQIEALRRVAGDGAVLRIRREPDEEAVMRIVGGLAAELRHGVRTSLGFRAAADFDEIIRVHVDDELGGRIPEVAA